MDSMKLLMCALLLSPAVALAQAEEPAEDVSVEEVPAEAAPAEEAAPEEAVSTDDAAAEEQGAEESAEAPAGPRGGHQLDLFFVPGAEIDLQAGTASGDEGGDGFGLRGLFRLGQHYAVSGEYEALKFGDNDEIEATGTRVGAGFVGDDDDGGFFGLFAEYDVLDLEELGDLDGYSVHGRLAGTRLEWLGFYGDLGYFRLKDDVEDFSGHELTLGVLFKVGQFGIFADGRRTKLEGKDSGVQLALSSVRAGIRFEFGKVAE